MAHVPIAVPHNLILHKHNLRPLPCVTSMKLANCLVNDLLILQNK